MNHTGTTAAGAAGRNASATTGTDVNSTRVVVDELLRRISAADPAKTAELYAARVDWKLDWPEDEHARSVPWIRRRSTRAEIEDHYRTIIDYHMPNEATAEIENIVVDGPNAVVVGELGQTLRATGVSYRAGFALYLMVSDGQIVRHHIFEDSLAVRRAFQTAPNPELMLTSDHPGLPERRSEHLPSAEEPQ